MRILHVVHQYPPDHVGGTELYTQAVARAQVRRGHRVAIFHGASSAGADLRWRRDDGIEVWAARSGDMAATRRFMATFGDRAISTLFAGVLTQFEPQVVHVQHLMGLPATMLKAVRRLHIPYAITLHDYWWICANAQLITNHERRICDGPKAYLNCARCALARAGRLQLRPAMPPLAALMAWRARLLRHALREATWLIAPTEFVRNWYATHGAPRDRLVVVPPALEAGPAPVPPQGSGTLRIAYVGGLSWQKGVHILVEAFSGVHGEAELWIAGDETADPAYVAHLKALATARVRFLGRIDRPRVWQLLAEADIVAVPTLWFETFSLVISEAFASGRPVLASELGPLADRVSHETDGLLAPPGDSTAWRHALQRLIDDPELLPRLRRGVRPPISLEQHVARLDALLAARRP